VLAASQTGRKIAVTPELVMGVNTDGPPQAARWHIRLDGPATVKGLRSGSAVVTETYIGLADVRAAGLGHYIGVPTQPSTAEFVVAPSPKPGELGTAYFQRMNGETWKMAVQRRADTPIQFEPATNSGGH
jgi:hypothetical protein